MNRRGQTTILIWIVALSAVLVLTFLFIFFVLGLFKVGSSDDRSTKASLVDIKWNVPFPIQENFYFFLNQDVDYNGKKVKMIDLINNLDDENKKVVREKAIEIFDKLYPSDSDSVWNMDIIGRDDKYLLTVRDLRCSSFSEGVRINMYSFISSKKIAFCVDKKIYENMGVKNA